MFKTLLLACLSLTVMTVPVFAGKSYAAPLEPVCKSTVDSMLNEASDETLLNLVISAVGGEEGEMLDTGRDFPVRYAAQLRHIQTELAERIRDHGLKTAAYVKLAQAASILEAKTETVEFCNLGMQEADKIPNFKLQANLRLRLMDGNLKLMTKQQFLALFAASMHAADRLPDSTSDSGWFTPLTGDAESKEFIYDKLLFALNELDSKSIAMTESEFTTLLRQLEKAVRQMPASVQKSVFYNNFADTAQKFSDPDLKRQLLSTVLAAARKIGDQEQKADVYSHLLESLSTMTEPTVSLTILEPLQTDAGKLKQEYKTTVYANLANATGSLGFSYKTANRTHTTATAMDDGIKKLHRFVRRLQNAATSSNININAELARAFALLGDIDASMSIYRNPVRNTVKNNTHSSVCETELALYCLPDAPAEPDEPDANVLYTLLSVAEYDFESFSPYITQTLKRLEQASLKNAYKTEIYRVAARRLWEESRIKDRERLALSLQLLSATQKASGLDNLGVAEAFLDLARSFDDFRLADEYLTQWLTRVCDLNNPIVETTSFGIVEDALVRWQDAQISPPLLALLRQFAVAQRDKSARTMAIRNVAALALASGNIRESIGILTETQLLDGTSNDVIETYQSLTEALAKLKDKQKALAFLSWIEKHVEKMPDSAAKATIYADLAGVIKQLGDSEITATLLHQALTLADKLPDADVQDGNLYGSLLIDVIEDDKATAEIVQWIDRHMTSPENRSGMYWWIARELDSIHDYRKAAEFARYALAIQPHPRDNESYYRHLTFALNGKAGHFDFLCNLLHDKSLSKKELSGILTIIVRESE